MLSLDIIFLISTGKPFADQFSLLQAAQTTNAWIITSGFNMGVMRAVGEAVAEAQSYTYDKNGMTHTLRCIGIAPWGYVLDNKSLINKNEEVRIIFVFF